MNNVNLYWFNYSSKINYSQEICCINTWYPWYNIITNLFIKTMADTESTCTSIDDRTEDLVSPTRDALVDGIVGLLKPSLDQLDERVKATR